MMVNVSLRGICGIYIFWIKDKLKMPSQTVISAWSQFSNLAQLQENANSKLKTKISEIATALEDDSYCVCFELITYQLEAYMEEKGLFGN